MNTDAGPKDSRTASGIGRDVRWLDEVESTNDVVKQEAGLGEAEGLVVVAKSQTKGRGRRGRVWESRPGLGLYLSVLLRPKWPHADAAWLAMVAGVAAADAVERVGVAEVTIKWPNDVLVRGKKIAGVLVEPRLDHGRVEFAVLGMGINVGHAKSDFPEALRKTATSLKMAGVKRTMDEMAQEVIASIDRWYHASREDVYAAWASKGGTVRLPEIV